MSRVQGRRASVILDDEVLLHSVDFLDPEGLRELVLRLPSVRKRICPVISGYPELRSLILYVTPDGLVTKSSMGELFKDRIPLFTDCPLLKHVEIHLL